MAVRTSNTSYAIVASQYNLKYTQGLADSAFQELKMLEPAAGLQAFWAPGAFEIPLLVKLLAAQSKYDAILTFGVLFEGETAHASLVAQSVTQALQQIAIDHEVPVLDGVLLLTSKEQADARCLGAEINRGIEVARAATLTVRAVREIRGR